MSKGDFSVEGSFARIDTSKVEVPIWVAWHWFLASQFYEAHGLDGDIVGIYINDSDDTDYRVLLHHEVTDAQFALAEELTDELHLFVEAHYEQMEDFSEE